MAFNCRSPILKDVNVRRAIVHAINVDRIIHDVYGGYAVRAVTDVPPFSWAANNLPAPAYDPQLARKILDDAGWRPGADGIRVRAGRRLELSISSATGNRPNTRAEEIVAESLRGIGVDMSVKNYAASVLFAQTGPLYSGKYDVEWTVSTEGTDPDDIGNWGCDYMPPHGANTSFYCDPRVDRYLRDAEIHYEQQRRKSDYEQAWKIMLRDVPALMIYWDKEVIAINSDLKNFKPSPFISDYWNAYEWRI
jgi:peptide/nickel transport system substrate-binding protein